MGGRRTAASAPEQPQTKHTRRDLERPSFDGLIRNSVDAFMPAPTHDDYVLFPPWQRPEHPNTVAYSAGSVCCPDETSARRHRNRATWWQSEVVVQLPHQHPLHALRSIPERRWTR